jgi:hypothetical protein
VGILPSFINFTSCSASCLQKQQLKTILATKNLSKDIFEIVQAALK